MTDKVQKIRNEVEKLKSNLMYGACSSQVAMETRCKEEAYNEVLSIMDSMQKEPKECMYSKDNYTDEDRKVLCDGCEEECKFNKKEELVRIKKGCKYRCLSDMQNTDTGVISFFKDKIYSAPEDNTLVSEENGWLCDTSENASNFELVEDSASEDLEQEINAEWNCYSKDGLVGCINRFSFELIARHFANWQKEHLMAKAVDAVVKIDAGGYPYIDRTIELYDYDRDIPLAKRGDKYKVILIKEG